MFLSSLVIISILNKMVRNCKCSPTIGEHQRKVNSYEYEEIIEGKSNFRINFRILGVESKFRIFENLKRLWRC